MKDFPPFYTLQPNLETRSKQLKIWKDYILNYHKENKCFILDHSIFTNKRLDRKCNQEFIQIIIQELVNSKNLLVLSSKQVVLTFSINEWGEQIYNYYKERGQIGHVLTWFEIINTDNQDFTGIDVDLLGKVLENLEKEGKAAVFKGSNCDDQNAGVKFF